VNSMSGALHGCGGTGMRRLALIGVMVGPLAVTAACRGSTAAPINTNGTAALHKLLEHGVAAERKSGSARIDLLETFSADGHHGQLGERIVAQLRPLRAESTATSDLTGTDSTAHVIELGGVAYMQGGAFNKLLPAGKTWLREPATKLSSQLGVPNQANEILNELAASSGLTRVGTSVVEGQQTTEYRFVMDFDRITANAAKSSFFGQIAPEMKGVRMPMRIWVDGQGLVLREQGSFSLNGAAVDMQATVEYGIPVHITAPPAGQVAPVPSGATSTSSSTDSTL